MSGAGFAPLEGIKVLELGHIMAGPVCGRMLADMGADVVKVERVPNGDPSRSFVPPEIDGESAAFMMLNRNKRGIAVDIKRPGGDLGTPVDPSGRRGDRELPHWNA